MTLILLAIPCLLLLGAISIRWLTNRDRRYTQIASFTMSLVLLVLLTATGLWMTDNLNHQHTWLRLSPLVFTMLCLSGLVGIIVVRFSRHYMAGEKNLQQFYSLILTALAAISVVIMSNHMLLLIAAWMTISITLHRLLKFYPDRPRAALAAHKKFLFARVAETALLSAAVLLWLEHDSWLITAILTDLDNGPISQFDQIAACLLTITAITKCAQMPVHGWLIQVVEAPTPVSALLHAGIVNLGGFLLLNFAPLIEKSTIAEIMIGVFAGTTTIIAALIMTTRVSIKVRLAWSTMAQMGLMLVEVALGLYQLAILHLIAHSLYKAHAFLNSGNAVIDNIYQQLAPLRAPKTYQWILAFLIAAITCVSAALLTDVMIGISPWVLMVGALTFLLAEQQPIWTIRRVRHSGLLLITVVVSYLTLKHIAADWILPATQPALWLDIWMSILFIILFTFGWLLKYRRDSKWIKVLYGQLYAGFYLDEWVSKLTLKFFPVQLPKSVTVENN
ncbi:MAG: NADH-quinone oxidoreductase subunit L [Gammaproteobacteria bacterium]|nr:NADH-quinone oxidoreductase subunit L [Gammaproteobacteria bacterium]